MEEYFWSREFVLLNFSLASRQSHGDVRQQEPNIQNLREKRWRSERETHSEKTRKTSQNLNLSCLGLFQVLEVLSVPWIWQNSIASRREHVIGSQYKFCCRWLSLSLFSSHGEKKVCEDVQGIWCCIVLRVWKSVLYFAMQVVRLRKSIVQILF